MSKRLSYEALHWGDAPSGVEELLVPTGRGTPVAALAAISYITSKEGKGTVFRHTFDETDGRLPDLLLVDPAGKVKLPKASSRLIALGRVIDFELADGRRVYTPGLWCVTTYADSGQGGPVLLASRYGPEYAIEHRGGNPHIREHGIIA